MGPFKSDDLLIGMIPVKEARKRGDEGDCTPFCTNTTDRRVLFARISSKDLARFRRVLRALLGSAPPKKR